MQNPNKTYHPGWKYLSALSYLFFCIRWKLASRSGRRPWKVTTVTAYFSGLDAALLQWGCFHFMRLWPADQHTTLQGLQRGEAGQRAISTEIEREKQITSKKSVKAGKQKKSAPPPPTTTTSILQNPAWEPWLNWKSILSDDWQAIGTPRWWAEVLWLIDLTNPLLRDGGMEMEDNTH